MTDQKKPAQVFFPINTEFVASDTSQRHVERSTTVVVEETCANACDALIQAQQMGYRHDLTTVRVSFSLREASLEDLNQSIDLITFGDRFNCTNEEYQNSEKYRPVDPLWSQIISNDKMRMLSIEDNVCGAFGEPTHKKVYRFSPEEKMTPFGIVLPFGNSAKNGGGFAGTHGFGGRAACQKASSAHLVGIYSNPIDGQDAIFAGHSYLDPHTYKGEQYAGMGFIQVMADNDMPLNGSAGRLRADNAKQVMSISGATPEELEEIRLAMVIMAPHPEFIDHRIIGCEALVSQFIRILNGELIVTLPNRQEVNADNLYRVLTQAQDEDWSSAYLDYDIRSNMKPKIQNLSKIASLYTYYLANKEPMVLNEYPTDYAGETLDAIRSDFSHHEIIVARTHMDVKRAPSHKKKNDNLQGNVTFIVQKSNDKVNMQVAVRESRVIWHEGKIGPHISMTLVGGDDVSALLRDAENVQHDQHNPAVAKEKGWNQKSSLDVVSTFKRGAGDLIRKLDETPHVKAGISNYDALYAYYEDGQEGKSVYKKVASKKTLKVNSIPPNPHVEYIQHEMLTSKKNKFGFRKIRIWTSKVALLPFNRIEFKLQYSKEGNDGQIKPAKGFVDMHENAELESMSRGFGNTEMNEKSIVFEDVDNNFEVVLEFNSIPGMTIQPVFAMNHVVQIANVA